MRVLVTGATGFVGRHLVPALLEAGHDVVALVRDPDGYEPPPGVDVVAGDLLDPESVAFPPVDAAYYLVHSMGSGSDFEARDRLAARTFLDRVSAAGAERIVYLGGLGDDRDALSEHLRSRREVEWILADGDVPVTVLRAAIVVGRGSAGFEVVRQLAGRLPAMVTPRWVRTPCQPVAVRDAVRYLAGVLEHPETAGETYEIGGPEVLTYQEMIERTAAAAMSRQPLIVPVPVLSPRLSAYWLRLVTDVDRAVAVPLIEGLRNPVVVRDDAIRSVLDFELTPFDRAVREALE